MKRERERTKKSIYIYCIFHLRMIETVLWWIVSVAGDSSIFASRGLWVSALCHIAQRLNSSDFSLNRIESNWINMNCKLYNIRTLWSSSLPGCALDILRQCQISASIESWDCSPKNATVKNVWSLCDFTRNQKWLIFWSAFICLSKYVFVDDRLLDLRPPSLLTLATIWVLIWCHMPYDFTLVSWLFHIVCACVSAAHFVFYEV
jgi:hypothetical protein